MTQPPLSAPPHGLLRHASLFLDFDGTLVELASRPDAVAVDARLHALMRCLLTSMPGRVAVVSGRPADQIRELFGEAQFTVSGSHGLEFHFAEGRTVRAPRPEALDIVLAEMHALADRLPGVLVEDKPLGAALHYRNAPDQEGTCRRLAEALAIEHELQLQTGKMMIEVRVPAGDKGIAIRMLMAEPAMAGTRPIFLGDDDTDEPGFFTAAELGGAGVLVGEARETDARYRLGGVAEVLDWLESECREAA